jgi:hypothetical protein
VSEKRLSEIMSDTTHAVGEAQDALQGAITEAINTHFDAGIQFERERIDGILDSWEVSLCKCDVCKSIKAIRAEIKGEKDA